jgi:peptide/nickel transport system substrate-binding protein
VAAGIAVLAARSGIARPVMAAPDSVDFISTDAGLLTEHVKLTGVPAAIAVGAGSIWAVDTTATALDRVDPISSAVQTIPTGLDPTGVATGGGSVWVADHDDNTVSRISPQTDTVVQTIAVGAGPSAVAYGYGSVWVTNGIDRTLTRIDPATARVVTTIATNATGAGIAIGGGSVWVSDEATNRVIGVDPVTNAVQSTTSVGSGPTAVAFGAHSVWVVNALDGTVSRVAAKTLTVQTAIPVPGGPASISVAGGAVWVGAQFGDRVVRIDPLRDAVAASIRVGSPPVALAATSTGVWLAAQPSGVGHHGGRVVVVGDDPDSIDPAVGNIYPELAQPVYDALTGFGSDTAGSDQIVPDLAVSLPQPTGGGRSYTFRLRSGIRYSNGQPLRTIDFRRDLARVLELNGTFASMYTHIVGAAQCIGKAQCDLSRGVIVQGTSTITFRLTKPDPRFFEELLYLNPAPAGTPAHDVGTDPVPGTGPYYIASYVPGKLITFERNRYFHVWSKAAQPDGYPDEIVYEVVSNPNRALQRVIAGRADLVTDSSEPPMLARFAAAHPSQVHVEDEQAVVFVFLNVRQQPFSDVRVRRALNYAVDREHLASLYGGSLAQPTCQLVPPTVTGYRPYCPYTINPNSQGRWSAPDFARARSLVRASGTEGAPVVLWSFPDYVAEAKYVVAVLDRLGYRARLHEISDVGRYFDTLAKSPPAQAGMFGWYGGFLAVDNLATVECDAQLNPARFCDHRIDAQVDRLAATEPTDPGATRDLAAQIDSEITDQAPWVPLFTPRVMDVTSARIGNYRSQQYSEVGGVPLDQLWVKR